MRPGARVIVAEMARRRASEQGRRVPKNEISAKGGEITQKRLAEAGSVLDFAPDLIPDVLAGRMGLQAAADVAHDKKRAQKDREAKSARLKASAPDLFELVEEGRLAIEEAVSTLARGRPPRGRRRRARPLEGSGAGLVNFSLALSGEAIFGLGHCGRLP